MTIEPNECNDEVIRSYNILATKYRQIKSENTRLKSELLALSEKLADANIEIARMGMVLKHRAKDMQSERQPGKQSHWLQSATRHH